MGIDDPLEQFELLSGGTGFQACALTARFSAGLEACTTNSTQDRKRKCSSYSFNSFDIDGVTFTLRIRTTAMEAKLDPHTNAINGPLY